MIKEIWERGELVRFLYSIGDLNLLAYVAMKEGNEITLYRKDDTYYTPEECDHVCNP